MAKEVEREIKLLIDEKYRNKLWNMPLIKEALKEDSIKTAKLYSTYYDTKDYKLANTGMAYRIRKNGKSYEATVKTMGQVVGGFSSRNEYTIPLDKKKVVLSGFAQDFDEKLQTLTADDELLKLFDVVINRTACLLQISQETIVEMAVDEGEVKAEGTSEPISEVELEIKQGNAADLFNYVTELAQKVPVFVENRSKFKRGLDILLGRESQIVETARLPYLSSEENAEDEIKKVFYHYIDKIMVGQNLTAQKAELQDADVLLLPAWEALLALWNFVEPLIPEQDFVRMRDDIKTIIRPLLNLAKLHIWRRSWTELNAISPELAKPSLLDQHLRGEEKAVLRSISKDIRSGHYSSQCFSLLAYLTGHTWQKAAFLQLNQFIDKRWSSWQEGFGSKGVGELSQNKKMAKQLCLFAQGFVVLGAFVKTNKLGKGTYKHLEEFTTRLTNLFQAELTPQRAALLCHGVKSKLLYKDLGILQGFLLAQDLRSWKKLAKLGDKLHKK